MEKLALKLPQKKAKDHEEEEEFAEKEAEKVQNRKDNEESMKLFKTKFGILKKASVLSFYGRYNDAFDEIAKAANIVKSQDAD